MARISAGPHWWDVEEDAEEVMRRLATRADGQMIEVTQLVNDGEGQIARAKVHIFVHHIQSVREDT